MSALGLHQLLLPPSGVEYAAVLKLTPSTVTPSTTPTSPSSSSGRALYNVVLARSNYLRIYEVREEPIEVDGERENELEKKDVRKGTEAVEGEVAMDEGGEGFVNVGSVKSTSAANPPTSTKFHFVREHILHGTITGIQRVRVMSSAEDELDRLIVSFKDAKIALLEWSQAVFDLITVSIHTYERTPQVMAHDYPFQPLLRTDPESRCAALLLPQNTLAILPFYQSQADIDVVVEGPENQSDVPYSPSFLLNLHGEVDNRIENVIDFVFLPGFNQPTVAVLFEPQRTWTGRLHEHKDTMKVFFFILDSMKRNYPVITIVEGLPSDCLALSPCPAALGGVVVHAANSLIHIDQGQRKIGLPVNGWASRVTDMPMLPPAYPEHTLTLEGAFTVFADGRTLFVIHQDGTIYPVEFTVEGQNVSKISMGEPVARTTMPSVACRADENHVFVGSDVGPSVLLRVTSVEEVIKEERQGGDDGVDDDVKMETDIVVEKAPDAMNIDDDDIYGPSSTLPAQDMTVAVAAAAGVRTRTVIHAHMCDAIPGRGPIADAAFSVAKNGEKAVPELVTATGAGELGGFTLFQRDLPARIKRKLHPVGGARGVWALPVRQAVKVNGSSLEKPVNPLHAQNDTVLISTDHNPSPGLSRISTRTGTEGITVKIRIPGMTIGAAPFFNGTAILHVMNNSIRLLEPDGTQRQIIEDVDKNVSRPKIKHCSILDPFVLIVREDETIGLFIGEMERGKIRRKDMSPMGDKSSRYIAGSFFNDTTGLFTTRGTVKTPDGDSSTTTLQGVMDASEKTQWLMLCRPQGVMEIWSLPKLSLVFSSTAIASLQPTLVDTYDPPALSVPQDTQRRVPAEFDIEQVLVSPMGEASPLLHLLVFLRSGDLAIYQALPALDLELPAEPTESRTTFLGVRFVKLLSQAYDIQRPAEEDRSILAEQRRIVRQFIPFTTTPAHGTPLTGVFFTGDHPSWIIRTDRTGLRIHPSGHAVVNSLTTCSLWGLKSDFLVYSDEGPTVLEWISGVDISGELPSRFVPRGKSYSHVVYEPTSGLVVGSAVLRSDFSTFDEDNNEVWTPDAPNVAYPKTDASALELLTPEGWVALDGYDFAYNEFVNVMECVPLETLSTATGRKNYIAVATTINRGEDLAAKGATYVFEVVEVNPDPAAARSRSWKLRLRCRDDAKGPVTALCGIDNYLVSSMGQKIFIRALDLDERLVGVAFLDVGVYVTSLRAMKNLLLIGDAVKSLSLVAFQEDPYKLTVLARDNELVSVTSADFFFTENALSLVTCDEEGIVRMYEYSPQVNSDPEARNGLQLLCRTEFHVHTEYRSSLSIARRSKAPQASPIPQSKLICVHPDGALTALAPVDEDAFKRLFLLQGQLARNVQHTAGLNPRAFRTVQNPTVAKPLARGVLDGTLLAAFGELSLAKQEEITRQIGTERGLIVHDLAALAGPW